MSKHQAGLELQALMLRRAYELGTLSGMKDLRAAPTAGKRRAREQGPILARRRLQEEYWRFYRTDDLILAAESYDVRAFCGGELVRHYHRVDKASRPPSKRGNQSFVSIFFTKSGFS